MASDMLVAFVLSKIFCLHDFIVSGDLHRADAISFIVMPCADILKMSCSIFLSSRVLTAIHRFGSFVYLYKTLLSLSFTTRLPVPLFGDNEMEHNTSHGLPSLIAIGVTWWLMSCVFPSLQRLKSQKIVNCSFPFLIKWSQKDDAFVIMSCSLPLSAAGMCFS